MEVEGYIYKIENLVNGKVYIGQTIKNPERRFQAHKSLLRRNKHDNFYLQNAWNKHGEKNFRFVVYGEFFLNWLDEIEMNLIDEYRKCQKCYNLESGGNVQKKLHDATKLKLSNAIKQLHQNEEFRKRYLQAIARKIICINTGKIYNSVVEAAVEFDVNYHNISQVVLGKNKCITKDGMFYQFSYFEEGKVYQLKKINEKSIKKPKKVICVNTGEIFRSTREAAEKMNVNQSKVSLCCNGKRKYTGKDENGNPLKWAFV